MKLTPEQERAERDMFEKLMLDSGRDVERINHLVDGERYRSWEVEDRWIGFKTRAAIAYAEGEKSFEELYGERPHDSLGFEVWDTAKSAYRAGRASHDALVARCAALGQQMTTVREALGSMLIHSHISDSADEDKFPEDLAAESAARRAIAREGGEGGDV